MPIRFQCDCGYVWNAPDGAEGRLGWCRQCRAIIRVPGRRSGPDAQSDSPTAANGSAKREDRSGRLRMLLVDLDAATTAMAREFLTKDGYDVETAASQDEVDAALKRFVPDLALVSAELPEDQGFRICASLNATLAPASRSDSARLAMLAADWDKQAITRARQTGAQAFLHRPATYKEFLGSIRRLASSNA